VINTLNAAVQLAELGYRVFPCRPGEKIPACEHGCKDATGDINQIDQWWTASPAANIGVSTDGLIVIDPDIIAGEQNPWLNSWRLKSLSESAGAVVRTPRGGWHFYYRQPDGCDYRNTAGKISPNVDTRATGGYVVCPPSATATGGYVWVSELTCPIESLPTPPTWLIDELTSVQVTKSPTVELGFTVSTDPQISEGGRNATLTSLAGKLRSYGMTTTAIDAALQVVNRERCNPPLPSVEVSRVAASIGGKDGPDIEIVEDLEISDIGSIFDEEPRLREPIIEGLQRRGETLNFVASTKVGKSWASYGLGLSIAAGLKWLGRFQCHRGRVLHIDNELHKTTLDHRLWTMLRAMGLQRHEVEGYHKRISLRGKLRDFNQIRADLRKHRGDFDYVILDALYRARPEGSKENSNDDFTMLYNAIDAFCEEHDVGFAAVVHSTKGNQSDKSVTDVGAGGGAQSRATDTHLVMRSHQEPGCVVVDAAVRSWAPIEPFTIRWGFPLWVPADDLDPQDLARQPTKQDQRQQQRDGEGFDKIVDALRFESEPLTERAIRKFTKFGYERNMRLIGLMVDDGRLVENDSIISGETVSYELADHLLAGHGFADNSIGRAADALSA